MNTLKHLILQSLTEAAQTSAFDGNPQNGASTVHSLTEAAPVVKLASTLMFDQINFDALTDIGVQNFAKEVFPKLVKLNSVAEKIKTSYSSLNHDQLKELVDQFVSLVKTFAPQTKFYYVHGVQTSLNLDPKLARAISAGSNRTAPAELTTVWRIVERIKTNLETYAKLLRSKYSDETKEATGPVWNFTYLMAKTRINNYIKSKHPEANARAFNARLSSGTEWFTASGYHIRLTKNAYVSKPETLTISGPNKDYSSPRMLFKDITSESEWDAAFAEISRELDDIPSEKQKQPTLADIRAFQRDISDESKDAAYELSLNFVRENPSVVSLLKASSPEAAADKIALGTI